MSLGHGARGKLLGAAETLVRPVVTMDDGEKRDQDIGEMMHDPEMLRRALVAARAEVAALTKQRDALALCDDLPLSEWPAEARDLRHAAEVATLTAEVEHLLRQWGAVVGASGIEPRMEDADGSIMTAALCDRLREVAALTAKIRTLVEAGNGVLVHRPKPQAFADLEAAITGALEPDEGDAGGEVRNLRADVAALTRERDALLAVMEAATELLDTQDRPHLSDDSHKRNVRDGLRAAIAAASAPTPESPSAADLAEYMADKGRAKPAPDGTPSPLAGKGEP